MSVDLNKLKSLLLDEEKYVRESAAKYLAEGGLGDAEAAGLVLQACERHGAANCVRLINAVRNFPFPVARADALLERILDCRDENTHLSLFEWVGRLPLPVADSLIGKLGGQAVAPRDIRQRIEWRRRLERTPPAELLESFMEYLDPFFAKRIEGADWRRCQDWVHAIARGGEDVRAAVLETFMSLRNAKGWPPIFLTDLAGLLKIHETIPVLVDYLDDEESGDYLYENATEALGLIGHPEAARLIESRYAEADFTFKIYTDDALGRLKHPESARTLLSLKETMKDDFESCSWLFQAFCKQLLPEAFDWARERYADDHTGDDRYMMRHLITTAKLHDLAPPELGEWQTEIREEEERFERRRLELADWGKRGTSGWADEDEDEDERQEPYRREGKKVGRNEPCPCGSGKKYKKCCLNKQ